VIGVVYYGCVVVIVIARLPTSTGANIASNINRVQSKIFVNLKYFVWIFTCFFRQITYSAFHVIVSF